MWEPIHRHKDLSVFLAKPVKAFTERAHGLSNAYP